jgi:hypothetical protein
MVRTKSNQSAAERAPLPWTEDLQTIGPEELGRLIGRSTKTIKVDASRKPETLPPRFEIPGTRLLRWRVVDVRRWMEAISAIAEADRVDRRRSELKQALGYSQRTRSPVRRV